MVYYRKKRTPVMRRKRVTRKRMMRPRISRPMPVGVVNIKRAFFFDSWVPNSSTTNGFWRALTIRFNQVPQFAELAAVFGQYRINAVKFTLLPSFTGYDGSQEQQISPAVTPQTHMYVCYDKWTTQFPTGTYSVSTLNNFMEQGRVKIVKNANYPIIMYTKRPTYAAYDSITTNANNYKLSSWQRTDNNNISVEHYTTQVFVNSADASFPAANVYQIFCTVYMSLKNQR